MSRSVPEVLRGGREAQRLGIDEVARRSGVAFADVVALERGDFGAFGGRVHAKASVRAVAKALDLDPEPLLLDLDNVWPADAPPPPARPSVPPTAPASVAPPAPPSMASPAPPSMASPAPPSAPPSVPPSVPPPPASPGAATSRDDAPSPRRARWLIALLVVALLAAAVAWFAGWLAAGTGGGGNEVTLAALAAEPALEVETATAGGPDDLPGTIVAGGSLAAMAVDPADTAVQVLNASGDPAALEAAVATLTELGYDVVATSAARQVRTDSVVYFNDGWEGEARMLVDANPHFGDVLPNDRGLDPDLALHVLIGQDWLDQER